MPSIYKKIIKNLEGILLEEQANDDAVIVSHDQFQSLSGRVAALSTPITGNTNLKLLNKFQSVYVFTLQDPTYILDEAPSGIITPRYEDSSIVADGTSNRQNITWKLSLDILTRGNSVGDVSRAPTTLDRRTQVPGEYPTGIYHPERGPVVEYIYRRLSRYPTLNFLNGPSAPTEPMEQAPYLYSDSEGQISLASFADGTDLNYWTLVWSYGLPTTFAGWWPTTIDLVVEHKFPNSVHY